MIHHELLLFAAIVFLIGALDDGAVDAVWLWLRARRFLSGKRSDQRIDRELAAHLPFERPVAVFIPAWQEAGVIGHTIRHALSVWHQPNLRLYIGCYSNDPDTIAAAMKAAFGDPRLRIITHYRPGPSTKADCLNRLYEALIFDEQRSGELFSAIVFHDAEDLVDPAGLTLLEGAIRSGADFAQLPVIALPQRQSRWLGSHYCEEFAEAHGKAMVVRDALGASLPAAGVGCAISRAALRNLRDRRGVGRGGGLPFDENSLTEDYEMGLAVGAMGGRCRFLRWRGHDGRLIATRAYFPSYLGAVVRQKTRWMHGIALQGWDRIGWQGGFVESWMRARDRRGPLAALVLVVGYALLILTALLMFAIEMGWATPIILTPLLKGLVIANFIAFLWRALMRFAFTARDYGMIEAARAVLRYPLANIVAIMAGRRALQAYWGTLKGARVKWDKTHHSLHPAR